MIYIKVITILRLYEVGNNNAKILRSAREFLLYCVACIIAVNKAGIQTSNNFHISKGFTIYLLNTIIIFADKQNWFWKESGRREPGNKWSGQLSEENILRQTQNIINKIIFQLMVFSSSNHWFFFPIAGSWGSEELITGVFWLSTQQFGSVIFMLFNEHLLRFRISSSHEGRRSVLNQLFIWSLITTVHS